MREIPTFLKAIEYVTMVEAYHTSSKALPASSAPFTIHHSPFTLVLAPAPFVSASVSTSFAAAPHPPSPTFKCFNCGIVGHYASDCSLSRRVRTLLAMEHPLDYLNASDESPQHALITVLEGDSVGLPL